MAYFFSKLALAHRIDVLELYLVLIAISISFLFPRLGSKMFAAWERRFVSFAHHRLRAVIFVGIAALAVRAIVLPILPVPEPSIHDEFENLLMADTFEHFRVTNPPHPMAIHLETFHVLQAPTYTGIVPPAQGVLLAAGKLIGGHPFVGVWFGIGAMCAAICWMLQAWLPPSWALFGALVAIIRFGLFSYWSNSYWGGAVAATAGAVVLGALPRIWKHARPKDALLLGLGLAVLANSRPYEGFILGLPVAIGLFTWMVGKKSPPWNVVFRRVVLPLAILLTVTACAMAYYNWRVTGSPIRTAYQVSMATVNPIPYFVWQPMRPIPAYHYKVFREFYLRWALPDYLKVRSFDGWILASELKLKRFVDFYFGITLEFPLILAVLMGGFFSVFCRRLRFLSLCLIVVLSGLAVEVQFYPHYAAPIMGICMAFVSQGIRYVRVWGRRARPIGLFAVRAIPAICAIYIIALIGVPKYFVTVDWPQSWYSVHEGNLARAKLLARLHNEPGGQLIIVRYGASHMVHEEWVYNDADIDDAKVVWARDMGLAHNQELIGYFHDRHVWLLEPDKNAAKLLPYPEPDAPLSSDSMVSGSAAMY